MAPKSDARIARSGRAVSSGVVQKVNSGLATAQREKMEEEVLQYCIEKLKSDPALRFVVKGIIDNK
eukprot:4559017-Lingulodinium_polyedra.AAC.1